MAKYITGILRIGVVGFDRPDKFDVSKAKESLNIAFDRIESEYPHVNKTVVSGYTDIGIQNIAYRIAKHRGWRTAGIACSKATNYPLYPCDETIIIGHEWGEESETFLANIDLMIKVGGGKQSKAEFAIFKEIIQERMKKTFIQEFDLEIIK